jgi:hypothetical protein
VQETKDYRGVETVSGQHLYSGKLITGPSFCVGSVQPRLTEGRGSEEGIAKFSSSEYASTNTESLSNRRNITPYKVACCICITDQSLQPGVSTLLVIFSPQMYEFVLSPKATPLCFFFASQFFSIIRTTILTCWCWVMCSSQCYNNIGGVSLAAGVKVWNLSQWQVSLCLPCKTDAFTEDMSITNFEATDDFGCT